MNRNGLNNPFLAKKKDTARGDANISAKKDIHTAYEQYKNEVDETL